METVLFQLNFPSPLSIAFDTVLNGVSRYRVCPTHHHVYSIIVASIPNHLLCQSALWVRRRRVLIDLVERIIIDTYQYTMMCLLLPARTIALLAIQLAVRMLGFGKKVREFYDPLGADFALLQQAKLLFCDSIDDNYLVDMTKTNDVYTYFAPWINHDVSTFFRALVEHCRLNSNEDDDGGWRKLLLRSHGSVGEAIEDHRQQLLAATTAKLAAAQAQQQPIAEVLHVLDDQPTVETVDDELPLMVDNRELQLPRVWADLQNIAAEAEAEAAAAAAAAKAAANTNTTTTTTTTNTTTTTTNTNTTRLVFAEQANELGRLPLFGAVADAVVSSPPPVADPANRTSPPESSPEEGEVPLTRSLEALRRSVRTVKRRRVSESK
jgi:hypothetical protein